MTRSILNLVYDANILKYEEENETGKEQNFTHRNKLVIQSVYINVSRALLEYAFVNVRL